MVYVQHVFKAHPEQVFLRYFWLFLWLHFGLEICKVIRVILPKTCKFNTHNLPTFLYKSMCYDLFRSDFLGSAGSLWYYRYDIQHDGCRGSVFIHSHDINFIVSTGGE